MAANYDKESESIIISGFEQGIQPSPHKGIANLQNVNISTETGEVINSFARVQNSLTDTTATGSLTFLDSSHVNLSIANTNNLFKGTWITVTGSSNTGQLPNATYFIPPSTGAGFQLSNYYNNQNATIPVTVNQLVAGSGGGGGGGGTSGGTNVGGGGGSGQVTIGTSVVTNGVPYTVTVGTAGTAGTTVVSAGAGNSSSFNGTTAAGGGFGGGGASSQFAAGSGYTGGGGFANNNPTSGSGGTGTAFNGGNGFGSGTNGASAGGGGGGAAGAGGTANSTNGGTGGTGISSSISGSSVTYGVGGGGGASNPGAGASTPGSGGQGADNNIGSPGQTGTVVISAPIGAITSATGGVHTTSGGNDIWTFTSSGTWTPTLPTTSFPAFLTGFTTGLTASFTMVATMGKPIAKAEETYRNVGTVYNRYYILDSNNLVWVYDTQNETTYSYSDNVNWILPDFHTDWSTSASGIAVLSGFLMGFAESGVYGKSVAMLGNTNSTASTWVQFADGIATGWQGATASTTITHFGYSGHQGRVFITDANYIAEIFPDSTIADAAATADNVQSFCVVVPFSQFLGEYNIISGTSPHTSDGKRVPVVFFTPNDGVLPTSITAGTVYYMFANDTAFQVYTASTGGSNLDIQTGQSGTLYFNTFYPLASASASDGATPTYVFTPQRLTLPNFEISQCMTEVGNLIIVGCRSNTLYPWDQVQNLPSNIISLPESNTVQLLTVHNMCYVFTGNKGNIYLTDGNVASAVTTVPDYCAGVPGTPSTYIESVFTWGGTMYLRGRVYFSILDQTTTKAGNCGGIWSFVPTQNLYIGQDVGMALRLENQSSYGTYNGYAPILIPKVLQNVVAPQYFSAWQSDITTTIYGIDATGIGTASTSVGIIETDLISTGLLFDKKTFDKFIYKLSTGLANGATVALNYRTDSTSAWQSCGTLDTDSNQLSGYYSANIMQNEWMQLQAILTPTTATPGTFIRLTDIRIRP